MAKCQSTPVTSGRLQHNKAQISMDTELLEVFGGWREWHLGILIVVGTITTMQSKDLIKQLVADGWYLRASKGSHHIFVHPRKPGHISVPHPKKDLGIGLLHKLLKQAGLR